MKKLCFFLKILFIVLILGIGIIGVVVFGWMYPKIFQVSISVPKNEALQPTEPVYVDFTYPVRAEGYESQIGITPNEDVEFSWEKENKRLAISPKEFWKLETKYQLTLPEWKSTKFTTVPPASIEFTTIEYPQVVAFTPRQGEKDVVLDIEDPIVVDFNQPMDNFLIKFAIEPKSELGYENNEDKTQFRLIPREKIGVDKNVGTRFEVRVYVKHAHDTTSNYQKIYQSSFETMPLSPPKWEKDFTLRLAQARKFTRPQIKEGKYIDINLDTQILSTFENGKLIDSYLISSGKKGMWTPTGTFKVHNKHPRAYSRTYGLYMPYWMAFVGSGKFGIHELPEWPNGYKEGANHLGIPVSHGCVRLGVGAAKAVYEWAEVGTPIVIY